MPFTKIEWSVIWATLALCLSHIVTLVMLG